MHADLILMLLADARLPVAGHTQSGTVEAALARGLAAADVPAYARVRLATVTRTDAGTAVVASRLVARDGAAADLEAVHAAWSARTPSAALRAASSAQGRALRRLAERTWPDGAGLKALAGLPDAPRAVVLGALAADLGLGAEPLARLVGYDDVQTVCAAALKLAPLDPVAVTGWVTGLLPAIDELAAAVRDVDEPASIPAATAPQIEAWAQAHARTTRRLFRA